jgi:DNA-binding NtrC family response regulator
MDLNDRSTFRQDSDARIDVRRFQLVVVDHPEPPRDDLKRGLTWESKLDVCSIGSNPINDLVIDDKAVSRFHCEVKVEHRGARVRDLESLNGTILDGVRVESAFLRDGSVLRLGRVVLRFELLDQSNRLPFYERTQFGGMASSSMAMRSCFALMERAAACDATVLFEGETGTGKTTAAEAIHRESARRGGLFLVVDCSTLAPNLIEDELFGHEKGAFTGAINSRKGVFEEADGGTVFLDEIGELPLDLQSKLLRVLESREVRRLGGNTPTKVDVRVIAATHKDLRSEMNAGNFRADLYYRLAVLRARIPALRERPEDIPMLVDRLLDGLGASPQIKANLCSPKVLEGLQRAAWSGNIRELRNHLERCKVFEDPLPVEGPWVDAVSLGVDASRPFRDEKERAHTAFEREYLQKLMLLHGGNVTRAAAGAKLTRVYLHRLLKEHGIRHE